MIVGNVSNFLVKYKLFPSITGIIWPQRLCSISMNNAIGNNCDNIQNLYINEGEETWIFGYGSLVWKADFPFEENRTGYVKGFLRRFFQNSIDHRGTHQKPGRVVTLIKSDDPEAKVWGMGYRIAPKDAPEVLRHLDHREKNGYDRHVVQFHPHPPSETQTNEPKKILLYVATQSNPSFAGQEDSIEKIAHQIVGAAGESGKNTEYVYRLADAMRQLYPGEVDRHLFELERVLKSLEAGATPSTTISSSDLKSC